MSKKIAFSFLLLSLLVTGCQMPGLTDAPRTTPVEPVEATTVKHYSDQFLSFDYPQDLVILREVSGEGSYSSTWTFMQWDAADDVYSFVGPRIKISTTGPEELLPADQYLKDQTNADGAPVEGFKEVALDGAQAFEWFSGFGMCDSYTGLDFLFTSKTEGKAYQGDFYGVFSLEGICAGARYQEVLDLFEKTVKF